MNQTLIIKEALPSLNEYIQVERSNRFAAAKLKKEATELVAWSAKSLAKITEPAHYHFHWFVKDKRKDPDNIAFACKFIFDGLQLVGKLKNDSFIWVLSIHHDFDIDTNQRVEVNIVI